MKVFPEIGKNQIITVHPETSKRHSGRSEESSADFETTRFFVIPPMAGFLRLVLEQREGMTLQNGFSGWTLITSFHLSCGLWH